MANITILTGAQWGDEGKGKWVDILSSGQDIIARFQGGNNAGHTLYIDGEKLVLHQLPSGIFHKDKIAALLAGVVIDPVQLVAEIGKVKQRVVLTPDNLWVSENAHVITPFHIFLDKRQESSSQQPIGTTQRGIGPTYSEKINRSGLRIKSYIDPQAREQWLQAMLASSELYRDAFASFSSQWQAFSEAAPLLAPFVRPTEEGIRKRIAQGSSLLLEGAQGSLLDINHGTYPFVTSSTTIAGGAVISLGFDPRKVTHILGIAKAYVTRVGGGPFPTELKEKTGQLLREKGHEFGATTNRPRRCGWFDCVAMRYAAEINGFDSIFLNKMDILSGFEEICMAKAYQHPTLGVITDFPNDEKTLKECQPIYETMTGWREPLPKSGSFEVLPYAARSYIEAIENNCQVKVSMIGTGPERGDFISN